MIKGISQIEWLNTYSLSVGANVEFLWVKTLRSFWAGPNLFAFSKSGMHCSVIRGAIKNAMAARFLFCLRAEVYGGSERGFHTNIITNTNTNTKQIQILFRAEVYGGSERGFHTNITTNTKTKTNTNIILPQSSVYGGSERGCNTNNLHQGLHCNPLKWTENNNLCFCRYL